ncbi:MAG TPA: hypothetical protein VJ183_07840 [Chloroflexia bacterium]|nr:hypothetical protein [Chloroflexia bacterium]
MNTRLKARLRSLALVIGLLVGMLGVTRTVSAHPANQPADPVALVMEMADAFNNADVDRLMEILDPSFKDVVVNAPAALPPEFSNYDRDGFIALSRDGGFHMELSNCKLSAPDTVVCDSSVTIPDNLPLSRPVTQTLTVTVVNGKITSIVEMLSDQSLRDFEDYLAASQAGMPTTGSSDMSVALWLLSLALLSLVAGVITRRTHGYRR